MAAARLDAIHEDTWPVQWTYEFTTLLTLLTRLVAVGAEQADLLGKILQSPLITSDQLVSAGPSGPLTPRLGRRGRRLGLRMASSRLAGTTRKADAGRGRRTSVPP